MIQFELIVDKDISLRLLQEEDAQNLIDLVDQNRSYLKEWLAWLDATRTIEDSINFIHRNLLQYQTNKCSGLGMFFKGELVGMIGLLKNSTFNNYNAGIGYWLNKESNGLGIVSKSCTKLINYGFEEIDLNRIQIEVAGDNTKSRNIPKRLGFKQEAILKQANYRNNKYDDFIVFGMLKENWQTLTD